MSEIPAQFIAGMEKLLGEEIREFLNSLATSSVIGLRTNSIKISPDVLRNRMPYRLESVPWTPSGFWMRDSLYEQNQPKPSRHPFHAAGLYYLQDPSAMAVAELLDPQPGELVIDLCAAPGGKTTHISALMRNRGIIIANETHPRRVWELAGNLERCGVRNAAVTAESTTRLAQHFGSIFDRVLVDAPCSGEAMFRKSEAARREWSLRHVKSCSIRQSAILEDAASLVRPEGVLVYSTCTFNPIENETVIARFLMGHPDFKIIRLKSLPESSPGRPDWLEMEKDFPDLDSSIRLWPHHAVGDGHFIAALRRNPGRKIPLSSQTATHLSAAFPSSVQKLFRDFSEDTFNTSPVNFFNTHSSPTESGEFKSLSPPALHGREIESVESGRLALVGSQLYWIPEKMPALGSLHVNRPGWWLGTIRSGDKTSSRRFEPAHSLAMALKSINCLRTTSWCVSDPEVFEYLQGKSMPSPGGEGWVLVTVEGYPLGWGKRTGNILKNHYPRNLRWS